jgi:Ca2+-binding EF-hand superfamily protein
MVSKLVVIIPILAALAVPASAQTQHSTADARTAQLLQLMDKDKNGKVSRAEFMAFMAAEFDRLDVNHDGELDPNELRDLRVSPRHPGGTGSR